MEALQTTTEIRHLGAGYSEELARLAELDTASPLPAPVIGAIVDGRLLAAHSLATGEQIADPFSRTVELRELLSSRARELRDDRPGRGLIARLSASGASGYSASSSPSRLAR